MERDPNTALERHLREAAWSDKGTARRVNEERLRRGRPTGYGGANVRGWLRGVVPDPLTREVTAFLLSGALGRRVTQGDLGFAGTDDPRTGLAWHESLDTTLDESATLWRAADPSAYSLTHGAYTGPTRDWLLAWPQAPVATTATTGRSVSRAEVDTLWRACETYQDMERQLGAGSVRDRGAAAHRRGLADAAGPLHRRRRPPVTGRRGQAHGHFGYAAYDGLDDGMAQRYFIQSLRLARASGDDALAAHIFGDMARHAIHIGDLREALALARAGQHAARQRWFLGRPVPQRVPGGAGDGAARHGT